MCKQPSIQINQLSEGFHAHERTLELRNRTICCYRSDWIVEDLQGADTHLRGYPDHYTVLEPDRGRSTVEDFIWEQVFADFIHPDEIVQAAVPDTVGSS